MSLPELIILFLFFYYQVNGNEEADILKCSQIYLTFSPISLSDGSGQTETEKQIKYLQPI